MFLSFRNRIEFQSLRLKVASLRNTLRLQRNIIEQQLKESLIKQYEEQRCSNFAVDKAAFIASSLNRTKRSIVLDRAMSINDAGQEVLLTNEPQVKVATISHFQTIAGLPLEEIPNIDDMNDRWRSEYSLLPNVHDSIYDTLLHAPTDEEWNATLKSLPNGKAAGISGIPYELLKHLPADASTYLKEIVTLCFASSHIPSEWKEATIYPIPKPQEWHCYLKNTRPITLLDTARKLMTRIMNKRLANILSQHKVMQGNNHAGLPDALATLLSCY